MNEKIGHGSDGTVLNSTGIPNLEKRIIVTPEINAKELIMSALSEWLDTHVDRLNMVRKIGALERRRIVVTLTVGVRSLPQAQEGVAVPISIDGAERSLGIDFLDKQLLAQALTHCSAARGNKRSNERLEFLGDAVLQLVVTDLLYSEIQRPEGELTNWRSALVNGEHLSRVAHELHLGEYVAMSAGEAASGGRERSTILENTFESIIGAIYVDQGFEKARSFAHALLRDKLRQLIVEGGERDAKSTFQEIAQAKIGITPTYRLIEGTGPDHRKSYMVVACIGDEEVARGTGKSIKRAELDAAANALKLKGWQ